MTRSAFPAEAYGSMKAAAKAPRWRRRTVFLLVFSFSIIRKVHFYVYFVFVYCLKNFSDNQVFRGFPTGVQKKSLSEGSCWVAVP